jgi:hypothetical protein
VRGTSTPPRVAAGCGEYPDSELGMRQALSSAALVALAAALATGAYLVINVHPPTHDDWSTFISLYEQRGHILRFAFRPYVHHWHPLFWLGPSLALMTGATDDAILPIRVVNCIGFFMSLCALGVIARMLAATRWGVIAGMMLFTFHQATVGVLRQSDSFGQIWGDALASWVFAAFLAAWSGRGPRWLRSPWGAIVVCVGSFVGLTGTERVLGTVMGSITAMLVILVFARWNESKTSASSTEKGATTGRTRDVLWLLGGVLAATIAFLAIRWGVGTKSDGGGRYVYATPIQVVRNLAQMAYAMLTPISTLMTFNWWTARNHLWLGLSVAVTVIFGGCLVAALFRNRREHGVHIVALLSAGLAACFPLALVSHVSEHYLAAPTFFFSLLFMIALGPRTSRVGSFRHSLASLVVILYLSLHTYGFVTKELAAAETGRRDLIDGRALFARTKDMPSDTTIGFVADAGAPSYYSCYTTPSGYVELQLEAARAGKRWRLIPGLGDLTIHLTHDGRLVAQIATEQE